MTLLVKYFDIKEDEIVDGLTLCGPFDEIVVPSDGQGEFLHASLDEYPNASGWTVLGFYTEDNKKTIQTKFLTKTIGPNIDLSVIRKFVKEVEDTPGGRVTAISVTPTIKESIMIFRG